MRKQTKTRPQKRHTPATIDDFARLRGNAAELARWLGTSASAISQGITAGRFRPDAAGLFWLRRTVASYCANLRESREEGASASEIRAELDYWRMRKLRQQVLEGRQEIANEVSNCILDKLKETLLRMREACAAHPDTAQAIRDLADELERTPAPTIEPAALEPETDIIDDDTTSLLPIN